MRKTFKATFAALLLGASASSASAQVAGSDTLFEMMNDPVNGVLANCPGAAGLTYSGGGSGTGEGNMEIDTQEVAPMSRFLDSAACSHVQSGGDADSEGCFRHSLDGLAIAGHESANEACASLRWSGTMALPSGGSYTFNNWRTVLRIIYAGQDVQDAAMTGFDPCSDLHPTRSSNSTKNCASEVRTTLINTWSNMFEGGCTNSNCTAGLKHAFRRDDVSGTTDTFLELLALPAISASVAPFCNGNETQDLDPVRRQCSGNGHTNGEQVCKGSNPASPDETTEGLGVVLPVLVPQAVNNPYVGITSLPAAEQLCSATSFGGAAFGDVAAPFGVTTCPNGAAVRGTTCKWPRRAGTADGTRFNCIAGANDRPLGSPSSFDARVYNLTPRNSNGTEINYQRRSGSTTVDRPMRSAYYRIHQNRQIATIGTAPGGGCANSNETEQIGCLVEASPCSIGFSGLTALNDPATSAPDANRKGFGLRSPVNPATSGGTGVAVFPGDEPVQLLLEDSCSATSETLANDGREDRYPFSRPLWFCTIDGVPTTDGTNGSGVDVGAQTGAFLHDQAELSACMQDRSVVDDAAASAGFVLLPAGQSIDFVPCP